MNDIDSALRNVSTLDEIAEFALIEAGLEPVAQSRHSQIAEMRADAQPVELFAGLHLAQANVFPVKTRRFSESGGENRVLLGSHGSDCRDAILPCTAPLKSFDCHADRGFAAPRNVGFVGQNPRLRRVIDILHEQRISLAGAKQAEASAVT